MNEFKLTFLAISKPTTAEEITNIWSQMKDILKACYIVNFYKLRQKQHRKETKIYKVNSLRQLLTNNTCWRKHNIFSAVKHIVVLFQTTTQSKKKIKQQAYRS